MLSPKLKALLATARIANVPSVVSNVFTGMMLPVFLTKKHPEWGQPTIFAILAGTCLYIAGNFLNDWYDFAWDQKNRPERAIPSGLFSRGLYLGVSVFLATCGFLFVIAISKYATFIYCLITSFVILYTILHKKHSYSIWIMGACRAGLYLLGFVSVIRYDAAALGLENTQVDAAYIWGMIVLAVLGLLFYIAGISLLARYETRKNNQSDLKHDFAVILLLLPALTHSSLILFFLMACGVFVDLALGFLSIMPFVIWSLLAVFRGHSISTKVSRLLAGISLVDSVYLFCLFIHTNCLNHDTAGSLMLTYIPILCFLSALLLQKIAPAT